MADSTIERDLPPHMDPSHRRRSPRRRGDYPPPGPSRYREGPPDAYRRAEEPTRERRRSPSPTRRRSRSPARRPREDSPPRRRPRSRSRSPPRRYRSRSASRSPRRRRDDRSVSPAAKRRRARSLSRSDSYDSEEEDRRRRRRRKQRERDGSRERSKRKKEKRDKKEKKEKKKSSATVEWGKYGIISEADMYTKDEEFRAWLLEERMLNPETLGKESMRKEFARFMEDYNTGTLPHEKYYNFRAYEQRMNALRAGETLPDTSTYDPERDLADMRAARKKPEKEKDSFLSVAELKELQKVERERTQIGKMKQMGLEIKASMGVRMDAPQYEELP